MCVCVCVCACVRAYVHASVRVYINLFVSSQRFHTNACRSVKLRQFATILLTRYIHRHREFCPVLGTHHK